ncbi:hypothetical protein [Campylobacter sp. MIT 21-1684]|nr:hypothetical protein [Campylobacter sp. MIT 21-1684]
MQTHKDNSDLEYDKYLKINVSVFQRFLQTAFSLNVYKFGLFLQ